MADDFSEQIADAHEADDHQLAHELIASQNEAEAGGESEADKSEPTVHEGPSDLLPVEATSAVYELVRAEFGEDEAAILQRKWGDRAVAQDAIVAAMLESDPAIGNIYEANQTDSGGLSREGVEAAYAHILDRAEFSSPEELDRAHPELLALYRDYSDEAGTLSPAGVRIVLAHLAAKSGFTHTYRAKR